MDLREKILADLKSILAQTLANEDVNVYLFGSWARHAEKQSSDIDIAVEPNRPLSPSCWIDLKDKIEESTIPYRVDIVNLDEASKALIQNVKKEGIIWNDFKNA